MTCHVARRQECDTTPLTEEQVETFLDLARHGDEVTFKELAYCLGVGAGMVNEFWTRTVARAVVDVRHEALSE